MSGMILKRLKEMSENNGWHVEKKINIGDMLTMIPMVAVMFVWATKVETRIAVLEDKTIQISEKFQEIKENYVRLGQNIQSNNIRLNDKIDKIIENQQRARK